MSTLANVRLLIADDDPLLLRALGTWFSLFGSQVEVARAGSDAATMIETRAFDVILTELRMPDLNGHQLLARSKALRPEAQVIIMTGEATVHDAIAALREGRAFDFVRKPLRDLHALNRVVERAMKRCQHGDRYVVELPPAHMEPISPCELAIVSLMAEGIHHAAIAERMGLSVKAVKGQVSQIYKKLGARNGAHAVSTCLRYGFL